MFLPDRNLGANMAKKLNRPMELWNGYCPTHNYVTVEMIREARSAHPGSVVMVHPECRPEIVDASDFALSTGGILRAVRESEKTDFVIGTEAGILHRLENENPGKHFFPLQPCMTCANMKKITLEDVRNCLLTQTEKIVLDEKLMADAVKPIEAMLAL